MEVVPASRYHFSRDIVYLTEVVHPNHKVEARQQMARIPQVLLPSKREMTKHVEELAIVR